MQPTFARRTQRCLTVALAGGTLLALTGGLAVPVAYAQTDAPAIEAPATPEVPASPEVAGDEGTGSGTPEASDTAGAAAAAEVAAADAATAPLSESFDTATATVAPEGWSTEHHNIDGMKPEWGGWTFHTTKEVTDTFGASGDRGSFSLASGKVAVVQSDTNSPASGNFNSTLWSSAHELTEGLGAVSVKFDTHYKQGQSWQQAALVAKFDGGEPVVIADYNANQLNKRMEHSVDVPAGAQNVQIGWQYLNSSNNWFWMIDNVEIAESTPADVTPKVTSLVKPVVAPAAATTVTLSGLRAGQQAEAVLGSGDTAVSISGIPAAAADGTVEFDVAIPATQAPGTLPLVVSGAGINPVTITVTVLNPIGEQASTTEPQVWWNGFDGTIDQWTAAGDWEFITRQQVIDTYGLDRRHTFTRASGVIAVAETKDAAFTGTLTSAPVSVEADDKLELRFDSHFRVRGADAHAGTVTLTFDNGESVELRAMAEEEESAQPRLPFTVPAGAKQVTVAFAYDAPAGAGSWMLDDVQIVKPLEPLAEGTKPEAIVDVFSDVQGANAKLQNQVLPGFRNLEGGRADVVISNGDLTGNGTVGQYDSYLSAFDAGGGNEYPTRISTIGNHEFYGNDGSEKYIERFLEKTGMAPLGVDGSESPNKGLWGEVVVDDKLPVLWIGSERHEYRGGGGPFVEIWDEQYNWLRDRLDHYRENNTPVLLSMHHVFENSVSGSYANLYKREFGDDQERMEKLIAGYPNVTVMSSHTHWNPKLNDWSVEQRFDPTTSQAPTIINTAAVTTQYGPSGDWGETGVGGADPAGMRIALYEDRLRATVYGFNGQAQPTELKHVDIALPTDAPVEPEEPVEPEKPVDPEEPETPEKPSIQFTDITKSSKFFREIMWMAEAGISTGFKSTDASGKQTFEYRSKSAVTREAMAAFLYRLEAPKGYKAPKVSPFADVKTTDKFYKQIAWMYSEKISTGTKQASGKPKFEPKASITREAMAAFLFRMEAPKGWKAPKVSPFADVKTADKFYTQIAWMHADKISTGTKQPSGKPKYEAKSSVTREAMAAFLYRVEH